jgi:glycosyltransferase involved in cell wall biosynthesis
MHIVIIGDTYPPMKTSGAVMLKDLADAFKAQSHAVTVIVPSSSQKKPVHQEVLDGINILNVKAFKTKDVSNIQRAMAEFINPFMMWSKLKYHPLFVSSKFDLIVWYSPTIFWGTLVRRIKKNWNCKSYLILRDIFPDWAVDLKVIGRVNPAYYFFKLIARYQYEQADIIGLQSPNSKLYFVSKYRQLSNKARVLWNWVDINKIENDKCTIKIAKTKLAGKKIFVYAGNVGLAQGINTFLGLIAKFNSREDIGFLFVGRGTEMQALKKHISKNGNTNVLFFPEIPATQLKDLYSQCHVGLIVLDSRHNTHNIPGKFLSYMVAGLPVFGLVNKGNDLLDLVDSYSVGFLKSSLDDLLTIELANKFFDNLSDDLMISSRCEDLARKLFLCDVAANTITNQISEC